MKLCIPSIVASALSTNASTAADDTPCASGSPRDSPALPGSWAEPNPPHPITAATTKLW